MRVAVTGLGIVSAVGRGLTVHRRALGQTKTALSPLSLFEAGELSHFPAGQVAGEHLASGGHRSRSQRLALSAAADALGGFKPRTSGVIAVGTTTGGIFESEQHYLKHRGQPGPEDRALLRTHALGTVADCLVAVLGVRGEKQTFSTACSSSANAIGFAAAKVAAGTPWALAGGVDALSRLTWSGFHSLKLLSSAPCTPFDAQRRGLSLGEAAAFLLLEAEDSARARGAEIFGFVTGWGCSTDAFHMTAPHPEGLGAIRAMNEALKDAGKAATEVGYVNAHGTATPANDVAEGLALLKVFGAEGVPVSSTKGLTGHTLGAAGAAEAIFCLLAMQDGVLPGTIGLETPDPTLKLSLVRKPRAAEIKVSVSNSFGFGGNNTALVLERA